MRLIAFRLVFVRKSDVNGKADIVLLDHGLYEYLPMAVRVSLCQFWEAIVLRDVSKMQKYATELGVDGEWVRSRGALRCR